MNSRNWPGHWPYPSPYPNHYSNPNPTTVAGQSSGTPFPNYANYGYAPQNYPGWGYYPQPSFVPSYAPHPQYVNPIQTSSTTPMMPPNAEPYQHNLQEETYQEVWESPQSPQSPWIRAFEQYENEEN